MGRRRLCFLLQRAQITQTQLPVHVSICLQVCPLSCVGPGTRMPRPSWENVPPPLLIQEKGLFWLDPLSSEPSHYNGISTPQREVYLPARHWALGIPFPEEGRRETLSCELWTFMVLVVYPAISLPWFRRRSFLLYSCLFLSPLRTSKDWPDLLSPNPLTLFLFVYPGTLPFVVQFLYILILSSVGSQRGCTQLGNMLDFSL